MLTDDSPMPFGKHKGKEMVTVSCKYLLWLYDEYSEQEDLGPQMQEVLDYVEDNMEDMEKGWQIENVRRR